MDPLRSKLIRLASEHPEFQKHLLPLLKSASNPAWDEFTDSVTKETLGSAETLADEAADILDEARKIHALVVKGSQGNELRPSMEKLEKSLKLALRSLDNLKALT